MAFLSKSIPNINGTKSASDRYYTNTRMCIITPMALLELSAY